MLSVARRCLSKDRAMAVIRDLKFRQQLVHHNIFSDEDVERLTFRQLETTQKKFMKYLEKSEDQELANAFRAPIVEDVTLPHFMTPDFVADMLHEIDRRQLETIEQLEGIAEVFDIHREVNHPLVLIQRARENYSLPEPTTKHTTYAYSALYKKIRKADRVRISKLRKMMAAAYDGVEQHEIEQNIRKNKIIRDQLIHTDKTFWKTHELIKDTTLNLWHSIPDLKHTVRDCQYKQEAAFNGQEVKLEEDLPRHFDQATTLRAYDKLNMFNNRNMLIDKLQIPLKKASADSFYRVYDLHKCYDIGEFIISTAVARYSGADPAFADEVQKSEMRSMRKYETVLEQAVSHEELDEILNSYDRD